MSKTWDYSEDKKRIVIEPPKQTLRISGHRLSTILGLNKYSTPFQAWCEITKLLQKPFEENEFIIAGRHAEPKMINYISDKLPNVVSIEKYYGNIFDNYRYNNFKDESNIFGGVIDAVTTLNDKKTITAIVECKTSSKPQEWRDNNVPVEYLLQGALYSYLKGLDRVIFECTFLKEMDYAHPENIEINDDNTVITIKKLDDMVFEIDGELLNIEGVVQKAEQWWKDYVETGISPEFDEKEDKEYLNMIRATDATKDNELVEVCKNAYELATTIKMLKKSSGLEDLEKTLKALEGSIKAKMISGDISQCGNYKISKSVKKKFNEDKFKEEHLKDYEKYCEETTSYTLKKQENGEGEE